ncbi:MAG: hypothetical protein K5798_11085 [Nitrosopumilus sp.]|uniref:hypothetical protein n=1 Tax=Nitrosopumilus sp. TaxID=2024843 RepID=UPI00242FAD9E|nr:hypothetical protein [Nitrosopumilus sp.]MCV0367789.1 hypothetical protein [Nitrosopumilus sp.]
MEWTSLTLSLVSMTNMIILGIIITIYAKTYQKTKAQASIGMIIFASLMFLHNIMGAYSQFDDHLNLMLHVQQLTASTVFPVNLAIHIAELGGLLVLLKITWD